MVFFFFSVRSMPIRKVGEVLIKRGTNKEATGRVIQVYRLKWVIHVERVCRDKTNGVSVNIGIRPSNCVITKLKLDNNRNELLAKKAKSRTRIEARRKAWSEKK